MTTKDHDQNEPSSKDEADHAEPLEKTALSSDGSQPAGTSSAELAPSEEDDGEERVAVSERPQDDSVEDELIEEPYEDPIEDPIEESPKTKRPQASVVVPAREEKKPKKRKPWLILRFMAWSLSTAFILGIVGILVVAIYLIQLSATLPSAQAMKDYQPPITTRVHAGDGSLIAEFARERRLFVPFDKMPDRLVHAFLSAEDKNFYKHQGIDPQGILRAAIANIDNIRNNRRLEGASTITQQVARNFLLDSEQKLERKVKEALIAIRMEQLYTKEEIMELYLNQIYLGWRSYGVASAALNYFDKSLEEMTLGEMAYLAALPKAPNNYHPIRRHDNAIARRNWVIERMLVNNYITPQEAADAQAEELITYERPVGAQTIEAEYFAEEVRRELYQVYDEEGLYEGGLSVRTSLDTELQTYARDALRGGLIEYDRRHGWRGPFAQIEFTQDTWQDDLNNVKAPRDVLPWQPALVLSVSNNAAQIGLPDGSSGEIPFEQVTWARPWATGERVGAAPKSVSSVLSAGDVVFVEPVSETDMEGAENTSGVQTGFSNTYGLRQIPEVNGGIVAMDPHTGRVFAMVGGFSFEGSEFNRATQAFRQPGSSFKPLVYATAMDYGYTPSSIMLDGPLVVEQGPGLPLWKPKNYTDKFYGESTLRVGIEQSRNLMTARLALDMGMAPIVEYARKFGVVEDLKPTPANALGATETTLYRMMRAYAILVNGGKRVEPTLIDRIQDRNGQTIYQHDERVCGECNAEEWQYQEEPLIADNREQTLDPRSAYQVVSMMEGAVLRGTGRRLRALGKPIASKTGTTNDSRDAWLMSFTPDMVVGAYVGFDTPRSLGPRETGGRVALPVVQKFWEKALADKPGIPFRVPPGIKLVRVNLKTGLLARPGDSNVILEAFKPGTEPTSESTLTRVTIGADGEPVEIPDGEGKFSTGTGGLY